VVHDHPAIHICARSIFASGTSCDDAKSISSLTDVTTITTTTTIGDVGGGGGGIELLRQSTGHVVHG